MSTFIKHCNYQKPWNSLEIAHVLCLRIEVKSKDCYHKDLLLKLGTFLENIPGQKHFGKTHVIQQSACFHFSVQLRI